MEPPESSRLQASCLICLDSKPIKEMFKTTNCSHSICSPCMFQYIASKLQSNTPNIRCPDTNCKSMLDPQTCRSVIPKDLLEKWDKAISEGLIQEFQKFYCPFKDCSALLVNDGEEVVTSSECPCCNRLFCAQCRVSWHVDLTCEEFRDGRKGEDEKLAELASTKKWMRCPRCMFYVERVSGCERITCRCQYEFCYICGEKWSEKHYDCRRVTRG